MNDLDTFRIKRNPLIVCKNFLMLMSNEKYQKGQCIYIYRSCIFRYYIDTYWSDK